MSRRAIALIVAVVLAAVATVALVAYVQSAHNKGLPSPVSAYVAKSPIGAGTSAADAISRGLIETKTIDRSILPVGAIVSLADIQGKSAAIDIAQGEVILASRFVTPGSQQTPGAPLLDIPAGQNAISVEVSTIPGVANFIQPGDHVSMIVQLSTGTGGTQTAQVKFLLQNVLVLQVGTRVLTPPANGQPGGASVVQTGGKVDLTLAVTPKDAEKVALATLQGTLYFTLVRPDFKPIGTPGRTAKTEFSK